MINVIIILTRAARRLQNSAKASVAAFCAIQDTLCAVSRYHSCE